MSIENILETVTVTEIEATQVNVEDHFEAGVAGGQMIMIAFD